jgi:hypothetical protein
MLTFMLQNVAQYGMTVDRFFQVRNTLRSATSLCFGS